jgi:hypothetical protein
LGAQLLVRSPGGSGTPLSTQNCVGLIKLRAAGPLTSPFFPIRAHNDYGFAFPISGVPYTVQGSFSSTVPVSFYLQTYNQYRQGSNSQYIPNNYTLGVQGVTHYDLKIELAPTAVEYDVTFVNLSDTNGNITLTSDWTACPPQPP